MAKDRKIDMVILGLLSHEPMTGYDIKKHIDEAISFFWKGSFGSIYPALSSLVEADLIRKTEDMKRESGRERILYEITDAGLKKLRLWLSDSKSVNDMKYEMLLKLFFGGAIDSECSIATIEAFEKQITSDLAVLKLCKENLSQVLDDKDHLYFYLTVTFGVETYEGYLRWCKDAKKLLA